MASRRLDISSLLCDDNPPPFSPLDALVHAATEERKRLDAAPAPPPQPPPPTTHLPRHHERQRQEQHHVQYQQHQAQEVDLRSFELDRRRHIQEAELAEQRRAQHLEFQRQQQERDRLNLLRAQELGRRHREEEERRLYEQYERQLREQREYELRLQEDRIREEHMREREIERELERRRDFERQTLEQRELERRELERRELIDRRERQQRETAERQQREAAERMAEMHRRQLEQHRFLESHPPSISHLIHSPSTGKLDPAQIAPLTTSIPFDPPIIAIPSTSQEDPRPLKKRRYSESPTRPISDDKERIARERDKMTVGELGYGRVESPTARPSSDLRRPGSGHGHNKKPVAVSDLLVDKERVPTARSQSHDREAHRVLSPLGGRRSPPGSQIGRAKAARKSDDYLLREPPPPPSQQYREPPPQMTHHREPPPHPAHQVVHIPAEPEPKKLKEESKVKLESKAARPRTSSDGARPPVVDDVKPKKVHTKESAFPPPPPPPPPPTKSHPAPPVPSKTQQDDAHEWFLQQYDEEPSPTMSARHEPPHTPSPSASPVTPNQPPSTTSAPAVRSPPSSHKALTPSTAAVSLEEELEELVSKPLPIAAIPTPIAIVKKQETDIDMDLAVDQAVTELVDTLEEGDDDDMKHEPPTIEVDVEDELLSLVDDRPPHPPAPSSASSAARRAAGPSATISNSAPTHGSVAISSSAALSHPHPPSHSAASAKLQLLDVKLTTEARQPSPLAAMPSTLSSVSLSVSRHTSTRPTSERGSMPPPASISVGGPAKKGAERASSVAPPAISASTSTGTTSAAKKKKESSAKATAAKAKATTGAAASAATTSASTAAKPKAKSGARSKKGPAVPESISPPAPSVTPSASSKSSKTPGTTAAKKNASSASRSRSTSVKPAGKASVGPESDVKAEKQEEEEDSDGGANEDDKLYCICKTKYDEDRFMIACDRCDEWYHTNCLHMSDLEVDLVDQFICPPCVERNPHLDLRTTYKQRCLFGLRHPDPNSSKACHKAARGAFSKYCSDECGVKYMQSRIDNWAKKGGKPEKLWESVKNADKREGVVCAVEIEEEAEDEPKTNGDTNGCAKMEVDAKVEDEEKAEADATKPPLSKQQHPQAKKQKHQQIKQRLVPPTKTKLGRETERLNELLDGVIKLREEIKRGMEIVVWRERLLQLATERAEMVDQCGWDQRLCMDDQEWADLGAGVLESYDEPKSAGAKEEGEGDMDVDGAEEQWWCPGNKVCARHQGWQTIRSKDVAKEKEKKDEALAKLTTREREIRKRIEDMLDPHNTNNITTNNTAIAAIKETVASHAPLKSSNTKAVNGHPKAKGAALTGDTAKKGKKRKAPAS